MSNLLKRNKRHLNTSRVKDPLDKIRDHYIYGTKLNEKQEAMRERLEHVHTLLKDYSKDEIIAIIAVKYGIQQRQSYNIIKDAESLLGEIAPINKDALRHVQTERLWTLYKSETITETTKLEVLKEISKLNGLYDKESGAIDWDALKPSGAIIFTSDPTALVNEAETDDIDFEEVDE